MQCEDDFLLATQKFIFDQLSLSKILKQKDNILQFLEEVCSYLCVSNKAKLARPRLVLYCGQMVNITDWSKLVPLGVAAEFIHAASLLHDDLIDNAQKRRGKISVNKLYDNATAVLAGNFLLTKAFKILENYDRVLINKAISVVETMTKASILELSFRQKLDITLEQYRCMAVGKTGVLFSWCGFAAAYVAKNRQAAQDFWAMGEHIGMLFQIADDLKDCDGDKNLKDSYRDLFNKEPTLPILISCQKKSQIKNYIKSVFSHDEVTITQAQSILNLIFSSGALEDTKIYMQQEIELLNKKLSKFSNNMGKEALDRWISTLSQ